MPRLFGKWNFPASREKKWEILFSLSPSLSLSSSFFLSPTVKQLDFWMPNAPHPDAQLTNVCIASADTIAEWEVEMEADRRLINFSYGRIFSRSVVSQAHR